MYLFSLYALKYTSTTCGRFASNGTASKTHHLQMWNKPEYVFLICYCTFRTVFENPSKISHSTIYCACVPNFSTIWQHHCVHVSKQKSLFFSGIKINGFAETFWVIFKHCEFIYYAKWTQYSIENVVQGGGTLRWLAFGLNVCLKDRIPIPDKRSVSISLARQDFFQIRSKTCSRSFDFQAWVRKASRPWIESSKSGIV